MGYAYMGHLSSDVPRFSYGAIISSIVDIWPLIENQEMYIFELLYNPTILATKASILLFYRRINPSQKFRIAVDTTMAICVLTSVAFLFLATFQCKPIEHFWNRRIPGKCIDSATFLMANGAVGLFTDILILLLPVPMIFRLRVSTKRKVGLCVIFMIGISTLR